jgi:UDP-2,3-diacylglucosamine hydrolase
VTSRLAIVAGGGALPRRVAEHARSTGRNPLVVGLKGFVDAALVSDFGGVVLSVGEMGKLMQLMRKEGCEEMVFAGWLKRPDFSSLRLDLKGVQALPRILAAAKKGDDALLREVMDIFAQAGFRIIGADDVVGDLVVGAGPLGALLPALEHWPDIKVAARAALEIGAQDIGQGAVARGGVVLATETQDGTDAMLASVALKATPSSPSGVLVKRPKPMQERRIDLPTIGASTLHAAAKARLAGIAVEAGAALVVDREDVAKLADKLGIFVYGFTAAEAQ